MENKLKNTKLAELLQEAETGNTEAQLRVGRKYLLGEDVEQDYSLALKWFREAAEKGHPIAQYNVAMIYYFNYGVERDCAKAESFCLKAADQGYPPAQFWLGVMYHDGRGVKRDKSKAFELLNKAANQGFTPAKDILELFKQGFQYDSDDAYLWITLLPAISELYTFVHGKVD